MTSVISFAEWNDAPDLTNADSATLVRTVDQFLERGENVTELVEAREQRDGIRVRLQRRLTVSAIEPAFEPYRDSEHDDDDWAIAAFERVIEAYTDREAIEERLDTIDETIESLETERSECVEEERVELTKELEELKHPMMMSARHTQRSRRDDVGSNRLPKSMRRTASRSTC